ncbi:unnamed protein product [Arctogadus glacialis]
MRQKHLLKVGEERCFSKKVFNLEFLSSSSELNALSVRNNGESVVNSVGTEYSTHSSTFEAFIQYILEQQKPQSCAAIQRHPQTLAHRGNSQAE